MEEMQKAQQVSKAMDSLVAANTQRQDLSALISLQDGPVRPILQQQVVRNGQSVPAVGTERCTAKLHSWVEQSLSAADGTTAGYQEGGKPNDKFTAEILVSNVLGRFGRVAAVTDTESAIWTQGGAFTLADGELERLFAEALDYATHLKTIELLDELEWCWVNGNAQLNTPANIPASPAPWGGTAVTSQFNGISQVLTGSQTNYGNATTVDASATPYNGYLTEQLLRDAARKQIAQNTKYRPDILLCTASQVEVINSFRPTIITMANEGLVGGGSVYKYNTGFTTVDVVYEPYLSSGTMMMLCTPLMKNAPLIPLNAAPLARTNTQIERMITTEQSVSIRVQKAHVVISNLNV